jgi:sugar lactone lactonase YvrE
MRYILALMLLVATPVLAADIRLPGPRAFPESVAAGADGVLYVSNFADGGIVRIKAAHVESWISPGASGSGALLGLWVQRSRGLLWACSNDLSAIHLAKSASGRSELLAFDLGSGRGVRSLPMPDERGDCGDIAEAPDGSLLITDGRASRVLRLPPGGSALQVLSDDPKLRDSPYGLDGIAIARDGTTYVNSYSSGKLFRLTFVSGVLAAIDEIVLDRPLVKPDGMRVEGRHSLLVTNAAGLSRVTFLAGSRGVVTSVRAGLAEPTSLVIQGRNAFVTEGKASCALQPDTCPADALEFFVRVVNLKN